MSVVLDRTRELTQESLINVTNELLKNTEEQALYPSKTQLDLVLDLADSFNRLLLAKNGLDAKPDMTTFNALEEGRQRLLGLVDNIRVVVGEIRAVAFKVVPPPEG